MAPAGGEHENSRDNFTVRRDARVPPQRVSRFKVLKTDVQTFSQLLTTMIKDLKLQILNNISLIQKEQFYGICIC